MFARVASLTERPSGTKVHLEPDVRYGDLLEVARAALVNPDEYDANDLRGEIIREVPDTTADHRSVETNKWECYRSRRE